MLEKECSFSYDSNKILFAHKKNESFKRIKKKTQLKKMKLCVVCSKQANYSCAKCNTFYCNSVCQKFDWIKNDHSNACLIEGSNHFWIRQGKYHPLVTKIDDESLSFDYITYYKLDQVKEQGNGVTVSVIDRGWGRPDKLNIFGQMKEFTHQGELTDTIAVTGFHGIMSATLVNGRRNESVGFLGGTAPESFVSLIRIDFTDTKEGIFIALATAAQKGRIVSRSGTLQSFKTRELGEELKLEEWTAEHSQRLFNILEKYDSVLFISAGNDFDSVIGSSKSTEWMNRLVENKDLMRRVLVVANFRPLEKNKILLDLEFSKVRQLINLYPDPEAKQIDDEIVIRLARDRKLPVPIVRATLRKGRERYTRLDIPFDIHALNAALNSATYYKHYSEKGAIVSYEAGIMQKHCVFVTGCDIYAMGGYDKLESNDGSSESTPIMTGIFARFSERYKTPEMTYADLLDLFKREYTESIGDAALWGLGEPNINKMFF